jgi:hypothetical protein
MQERVRFSPRIRPFRLRPDGQRAREAVTLEHA